MDWDRLVIHKDKGGMSFRSLRDFNLTMLGKQGWRLMANDSSLVNIILKPGIYYPNGSFLSATLANNPSFLWRSILRSQFLKDGCRWSIVNGESINVLNQPWLASEDNPYITSSHPGLIGTLV